MGTAIGRPVVNSIVLVDDQSRRTIIPPESPLYRDALETGVARINEKGEDGPMPKTFEEVLK